MAKHIFTALLAMTRPREDLNIIVTATPNSEETNPAPRAKFAVTVNASTKQIARGVIDENILHPTFVKIIL